MKSKLPIVVLLLLSLALAAGLLFRHNAAVKERRDFEEKVGYLSNQWSQTTGELAKQKEEASQLQANFESKSAELAKTDTLLTETKSTLEKTEGVVKLTQEQLEAARAEIARHEAKIKELGDQNVSLDKQATDLKGSIASLEGRIAATEKKLATSEGDRDFLLKELKRMQAEKADLERQFNDIAFMRAQVRKLREELAVSRRIEWLRYGLMGNRKGAELLQNGIWTTNGPAPTSGELNVEIKRDGSATVVPAPTK
jgi:chromosome segregation ATPase